MKNKNSLIRPLSERTLAPKPTGKGGAKQVFAAESDINAIIRRHVASQIPLPAPTEKNQFIDMTKLPQNLMHAQALKSRLLSTLQHFPPSLIKAVQADPKNADAHVKQFLANLMRKGKGGQGAAERSKPPAPTPKSKTKPAEPSPDAPAPGAA